MGFPYDAAMKRNVALTVASLLSILFLSFHLTDDALRPRVSGAWESGPGNITAIVILFVLLLGAVPLAARRSGYVIKLITSLFAAGMPVLVPDYRLAPENPYPAGLTDVVACLRAAFAATKEAGIVGGPLIVAGDSAGANLALAALLHEQRQAVPTAVAGALLFYGNYALDFGTPSYLAFENGPGLTRARMQRYWAWYPAAGADLSGDPLACPLAADDGALMALPPLYLMAGGVDPLLSDTLKLHQRLQALGRKETVTVVPGVVHGFLQYTIDLAAAREALAAAGIAARTMAAATA